MSDLPAQGPASESEPLDDAQGWLPLAGIRVVDFTTHLPGPFATMRLRELGASVLKLEPPTGDPARFAYGGGIFEQVNRGKRSLALDLKDADDRDLAAALCQEADVIVEGFRPSVARRLGVTPQGLVRPPLGAGGPLFCSVRPSDSDEGLADARVHDLNVVALTGLLMIPASWSQRDTLPARPALPLADIALGERAAQAILAGLHERQRAKSARTMWIQVGMLEALQSWVRVREATLRADEGKGHVSLHLDPANDCYRCNDDRWITISAIEKHAWQRLCDLLPSGGDGAAEFRGMGEKERLENGERVAEHLADGLSTASSESWSRELAQIGISVAVVREPMEPVAGSQSPVDGVGPVALSKITAVRESAPALDEARGDLVDERISVW